MTRDEALYILGNCIVSDKEEDAYKVIRKSLKALELIKTYSSDNANFALVKDSHTYKVYNEQFDFYLKDYEERGGGFSWYERDRYTQEEYDLLKEVLCQD